MKEGWEYKKLGEVAEIQYGTRVVQKKDGGSIYPVYGGGGATFKMDSYNRENCLVVARFAMSPQCTRLVKGKFFLNDSGLTLRSYNLKTLSQDYLDKCILGHNNDIYLLSNGMAQKNLDVKAFRNMVIQYPSSIEGQKKIVSELDLLIGVIEKQKAQLEELDKLSQSIFYDMFEGKEWDKKLIRNIAIVKIGPFGSALHKHDYISGGTPLVNPIHMVNGKIIADNEFTIDDNKKRELSAYLLKENDIVFGRRGDIGRCALVTKKEDGYICGTGSLFVRFNIEINPIYSLLQLSSNETKHYLMDNARGATMLNLNSGVVEGITIPLPPLSLQQEFAAKVEAIESMKAKVRQSLKEAETLFNSRMDYYFN